MWHDRGVGYTLTIARPKGQPKITKTEWKAFVANQPDMAWSTDYVALRRGSKVVTYYAVEWTGSRYRDVHPGHRAIPYTWVDGKVLTPAMAKEDNDHAFAVARALGAQLCGEDGPLAEYTAKRRKRTKHERSVG